MIVDAIVKTAVIDKDHQRLNIFSPKFSNAKPLAHLPMQATGKLVKFITEWDDVIDQKKPFKINGGLIKDELVGNSTLIRGMMLQSSEDDTIYIVMDPALL
jgi:hypothetical protein